MGAKRAALAEKSLLLMIFTDGAPTDDFGNAQIPQFLQDLASKPRNVFVQIVACTDDEGAVAYLNQAGKDDVIRLCVMSFLASTPPPLKPLSPPFCH